MNGRFSTLCAIALRPFGPEFPNVTWLAWDDLRESESGLIIIGLMIRRLLMFGEGVLGTLSSTALTAGVSTRGIGFTWTGAAKKGGGGLGPGYPRNTPGSATEVAAE